MKVTRLAEVTLAFQPFPSSPQGTPWQNHHDAGRRALRLALESSGAEEQAIVADPERGYLELRDSAGNVIPEIFLNVSHTEGMAVGAVGPAPIGVDVESLTRDPSRALERLLSPEDRKVLADFQPEDPRVGAALLLWTAKEAFSKALGLGMQAGMPNLFIDLKGPRPYAARTHVVGKFPLREPRIHWEIRENFLVTVCTERWVFDRGLRRLPG